MIHQNLNPTDPALIAQELHLKTIPKEAIKKLNLSIDLLEKDDYGDDVIYSKYLQELHKTLYAFEIVFGFDWMSWNYGRENLNDTSYDFSDSSFLELSMYLTAIFRAERFCSGTINHHFKSGTLKKIILSMGRFGESDAE